MPKVMVIGKSGRFDCLAEAIFRSSHRPEIFAFSEVRNPGVLAKSRGHIEIGKTDDVVHVSRYVKEVSPDFVVVGPEEPLAAGLVDRLRDELGIPCIGPSKNLARIESSKSFTRELLDKHGIPGNPAYRVFDSLKGLEPFLLQLDSFVIKPDGLTGGKGVLVQGEHFHTVDQALDLCSGLSQARQRFLIEEKLVGEEFSLQSFCDGYHVVDMVPVQDHKRAYEEDSGPNTGGMGSYSCANHTLPFLSVEHLRQASEINAAVATALRDEFGEPYKGILYGGFIVTGKGVRLIEYNARFGDPEVMNVLPLLEVDFMDVCTSIISGTLDELDIRFADKATVCKYLVPENYPQPSPQHQEIDRTSVPTPTENLRIYFGAVDETQQGKFMLTGSRALACVGIASTLADAERIAENAVQSVRGPLRHRKDIGTERLVEKRTRNMKRLTDLSPC